MAGKGTFSAYQQSRPINQDFTGILNNAENQAFKYREEQRQIEEAKAKAKAEKDKKATEAHEKIKAFKLLDTGSETLNGTYADAIMGVAEELHELTDKILDDTGKYTQAEKNAFRVKKNNLENIPENFAQLAKGVMGEYQNYTTGVAGGTLLRDEAYEQKFKEGFKGITLSFDGSGMPVALFRKGQNDTNGDGITNEYDVETLDSLNNVYERPEFIKKYDWGTMLDGHSQKLKSATNTTDNGVTSVETKGLEGNLLETSVNNVLYKNGMPSDVMKSFVKQRGMDLSNPEHLKTIENEYKAELILRSERGVVKNVDGNLARNLKNDAKETKTSTTGETTTPTKQTYGIYNKNIDGNKVNSVSINADVTLPSVKTEKGDFVTNLKVHNVTRDKWGRLVVEGSYQDSKSSKYSVSEIAQMQQAINAMEEGSEKVKAQLELSNSTKGAQNKRKDIVLSKEGETELAGALGITVAELDSKIIKTQPEVDEFGVPIK